MAAELADLISIYSWKTGREKGNRERLNTPKHTPSDVPLPSRLYLLKVPKRPQTAPSTGEQVFKYVSLLGMVLLTRLLKVRLLGAIQQA